MTPEITKRRSKVQIWEVPTPEAPKRVEGPRRVAPVAQAGEIEAPNLSLADPAQDDMFGEKVLTVGEAAKELGVSAPTIYRLLHTGDLKWVRHKIKQKRILLTELRRYQASLK